MSKSEILDRIKRNKPQPSTLPVVPDFATSPDNLDQLFAGALRASKGYCFSLDSIEDPEVWLKRQFPGTRNIASAVKDFPGNVAFEEINKPSDLRMIDVAITHAQLGVAENGTVWVDEKAAVVRILPFITQHLVVVLKKQDIVENMHLAYQQISLSDTGFGVFIGGPSKTADIEQSLVVGAQGARSHTVLLSG